MFPIFGRINYTLCLVTGGVKHGLARANGYFFCFATPLRPSGTAAAVARAQRIDERNIYFAVRNSATTTAYRITRVVIKCDRHAAVIIIGRHAARRDGIRVQNTSCARR